MSDEFNKILKNYSKLKNESMIDIKIFRDCIENPQGDLGDMLKDDEEDSVFDDFQRRSGLIRHQYNY